jgi:hypothetical protein
MNATWITLAVVTIVGGTKLVSYLLSDKRKLGSLRIQLKKKEDEYAEALACTDTIAMSIFDIDMRLLREEIARITK